MLRVGSKLSAPAETVDKEPKKTPAPQKGASKDKKRAVAQMVLSEWGDPVQELSLGEGKVLRIDYDTRCAVNLKSRNPVFSQTVYHTKGTRAHTYKKLIRKWLGEPKGSSLEYI